MEVRRSIQEILTLDQNIPADWEIISRSYQAVDIHNVIIDGDTFTNYGDFQFVWEKTYAKEPSRSEGGVIDNLNAYHTFITPHLLLNFSIMSIDDYRAIVLKDLSKNEFVVQCYDPIYNTTIKAKMYFAPLQMSKLYTIAKKRLNNGVWQDWVQLVGVHDYTVELIGTNSELDLVGVTYHLNPPSDTGVFDQTIGESDIYRGEEIIIGKSAGFQTETFSGKYRFTKWNMSPSGGTQGNFIDGNAYTINADLVLYAQWEATTDHTLSYNYGIADKPIDEENYSFITSKTVAKGKSIGLLPVVDTPSVKKDNVEYFPYSNGKWFRTPTKAPNSVPVQDNDLYWADRDSTIYLLYDIASYKIEYYIDGELYLVENNIEYNANLPLPNLVKQDKVFNGWYYNSDFSGEKASGKMPPYSLKLYGKWEDKE